MKECVGKHPGCFSGVVGCCIAWHVNVMWKEFDGTCDSFCPRLRYVYCVTLVVLWRTADVPTVDTMRCPCSLFVWIIVDDYFGARQGEWSFVVIELPV